MPRYFRYVDRALLAVFSESDFFWVDIPGLFRYVCRALLAVFSESVFFFLFFFFWVDIPGDLIFQLCFIFVSFLYIYKAA